MRQKKERFEFVGKEIKLNDKCGYFITMNPGYAGRTELPDNLKALFRPVTMIVPDLLQICEIMLFSEGFNDAKSLAKKMTVLYRLSREQLSKQYHYDFGMRALKSVLVMAGSLKRDSATIAEDKVLMRALRDMNLPKFVFEDVPLFLGLIEDLFPGLECPRTVNNKLKQHVLADLRENNFEHSDERVVMLQVDKVMQMYETMLTRHTSMMVGPTQGGKSTILETLARAQLKAFNLTTKLLVLNPKAQPVQELYGELDHATRDWHDGLMSKLFRESNLDLKPGQNEVRYIVFDGDVDALWVENMNSVMDDNKLLTLPNSERIRLSNHVKLMIEVGDLQYASPATVSRVGMAYIDPKNLGFRPMYEKWNRTRTAVNANEGAVLESLFEKLLQPCVLYVTQGLIDGQLDPGGPLKCIIPIVDVSMTKQCCALFSALVPIDDKVIPPSEDPMVIESLFILSIMWSVGGALVASARDKFDAFMKKLSGRSTQKTGAAKDSLPEDLIIDSYFDRKSLRWVKWADVVKPYVPPVPFAFANVLVPTVDTTRYSYLLGLMVAAKYPVLVCGESGTAKTVTINNFFLNLDTDFFVTLNVNFSSRTKSIDFQRIVEANVEKRPGNSFGPPPNKKMLIFIDDINMPQVDTYGTQQPLALLKFLVERNAMYGRGEDLSLRFYRDLMYFAAMAPPGGGRNPVDPRVVALYAVFSITFPSELAMQSIYTSILTAHLTNFNQEVQDAGKSMASATMSLYKELVQSLPATPAKFHYIFNLRDLSRVFEGVLLSTPDKFEKGWQLVRLWYNECLRIFYDRLITAEDRVYVKEKALTNLVERNWGKDAKEALVEPVLFGDYRNALVEGAPRLYEDLKTFATCRAVFDEALVNYNETTTKKMNLVLFQDAVDHLTRIHRILRMPRGNALLVGVGGSGKQSLTKLAAYAAKYELFEIQLTRTYNEDNFRDDLKRLYTTLGTDKGGSPVVFLFTDSHVKDEGFLELINNMLTSGIVPALFAEEEKGPHLDAVRAVMTARGMVVNKETCWNFWVNRCRDNLHIALCMSPAGDALRRRCRSFPGLVSASVIDWFFPWPDEALQAVATHFLNTVELPDNHRPGVVQLMVDVHQSMQKYSDRFEAELRRLNSVTPKNFLDFIENYRRQLAQFRQEMGARYKRLDGGLAKLIEAAEDVDKMRVDLTAAKIVVDQKSKDCAEMIKGIQDSTAQVESKKKAAIEKEEQLKAQGIIITKEKGEAEEALAKALPILDAAKEAVSNLDKSEIATLKAMKNPPKMVMLVFQCVMELKPCDVDPKLGWKESQRMMADVNFLNLLKDYSTNVEMTAKMVKAVQQVLSRPVSDPSEALSEENVKRVSGAALGLLRWVVAVLEYYNINKDVLPKQKLVKDLEKDMAKAQKELANIQKELGKLEKTIEQLTKSFEERSQELRELQEKADKMERQLITAATLIDGLGGERVRWTKDREDIEARKERLVGDCLLTASFLSYTGAFTFDFRYQMIYEDWNGNAQGKKLPLSQPFRLEQLLVTEVEISLWTSEGLPPDELSIQNGILTTRASRFPLCIDPQMQASRWIKERESRKKKLAVHTFNDSDFVKRLELCIQFGNPFLFEGVEEELDPIIDPVLEKALITRGTSQILMLGDKEVEWDPNFRLYLITKMANPRYSPEIAGKTMIINYMVTMQGLEDQLLNVVVGFEQAELQATRERLIQTMSDNNRLLVEIENMLLKELNESTGNLLDNANLISTLENAKAKSLSIAEQLTEMKATAEEIEVVTAGYRPAAKRGSVLYFSMAGLSAISRMYEHSLSAYQDLFMKALIQSDKDTMLPNRLFNIIKKATKIVYDYVCTGTFVRHKLMVCL
jgi:dynein heavy chain